MITEQERIIRKSQGYDLGFEHNGKKYWLNTNNWNDEKEKRLFQETGLKTFREYCEDENLVLYNPEFFKVANKTTHIYHLHYKGKYVSSIPQPINMSSCYRLFYECSYLPLLDLNDWDVSKIKDMQEMFRGCINLQSLNLNNWNVSNVKNMSDMFANCESLTSIDLSGWNVSNVKNMWCMF